MRSAFVRGKLANEPGPDRAFTSSGEETRELRTGRGLVKQIMGLHTSRAVRVRRIFKRFLIIFTGTALPGYAGWLVGQRHWLEGGGLVVVALLANIMIWERLGMLPDRRAK